MNKSTFIKQVDRATIEAAIIGAEAMTSGEIRVAVVHDPTGNPVATAQELFLRLGMTKTKHRNAVLILIAPSSHTFAVIGDEGVHQKCGSAFWQELTAAMSNSFKREDYTGGLKQGIDRAGELLSTYFPRQPGDSNELPDTVISS